jgi:hypothetical protein
MSLLKGAVELFGIIASLGAMSFLIAKYKRDKDSSETDSDSKSGWNH